MRVRELSRCVCDGRHRRGVLVARRQWGTGRGRGPKIQSFTTPLPRASLSGAIPAPPQTRGHCGVNPERRTTSRHIAVSFGGKGRRLLALRGMAGGGSVMVNASGRMPRSTAAHVTGAATGKQATDLAGRVTVIDAKPPACLAAG